MSAAPKKTPKLSKNGKPLGRPPRAAKLVKDEIPKMDEIRLGDLDEIEELPDIVLELGNLGVAVDSPMGEYKTVHLCPNCGASMWYSGVAYINELICAHCRLPMRRTTVQIKDED
jgi:predicted RNA-binding Zn-ribbon protein involved in translation (DUF1610 family)